MTFIRRRQIYENRWITILHYITRYIEINVFQLWNYFFFVIKWAQTLQQLIDIKNEFCLMEIRDKENLNDDGDEAINDLKPCFMVVDSTPEVFMIKDYDAINEFVR